MRRSTRLETESGIPTTSSNYPINVPPPETLEPEGSIHVTAPLLEKSQAGDIGEAEAINELGTQQTSNESFGEKLLSQPQVGKPQVIVRIRPSPNIDSTPTFEVDQQTKTIQIRVDRDRKAQELTKHKPPPGFIYFPADNVLENSSQEDTFAAVAMDVVEKAMVGIPGMIVAIGPEVSGKSFSLFGLSGRYRNRGIAARAMEKMFEMKDRKQDETEFKFGMGIIEVRRERIRDLLTLSPNEINDVGDRGPKGMYFEEVDCLEHGLGLMLRALTGQKLIHQEPYERYHTIVYFEIVGVSPLAPELLQFQSRITFAEIASAPYRSEAEKISSAGPTSLFYGPNPDFCQAPPPGKPDGKFKSKQAVFPARKCCNPGYTTGPLAESIAVRRDIFALEQIFLKANEMYRIRKYFNKLENLGLSMIASEKRRIASGRNFRQNRLAHCLKDILDTNTEIRIVLHVRPDKAYLKSSLESMRFAERARLVPSNLDDDPNRGKPTRTEDQILQEVITDIAPELMHPANVESLNSEKMKVIQEQAVQYFENNIDSMKVCSKEKVKLMFENFRVLWNFLWELELNVTLRKAEEDMKHAMEKMGNGTHPSGVVWDAASQRRGSASKTRGSDSQWTQGFGALDGDDEANKDNLTHKKSTRRGKKEKKKKKEKQGQPQKKSASSDTKQAADNPDLKRGSVVENGAEDVNAGKRRSSQVAPPSGGEETSQIKGETEVSNTSPPDTTEPPLSSAPPTTGEGLDVPNSHGSRGSLRETPSRKMVDESGTEGAEVRESLVVEGASKDSSALKVDGEKQVGNGKSIVSNRASMDGKTSLSINVAGASNTQQPILSDTTHIHHAAALRHNSTFFVRGGFADFKLHNVWGATHHVDRKSLTEEERAQLAAQQEQTISNNFEEMKKIARRQAIHLLRTGVRRPQWLSLF